jgi:hypothetical protein
MASVAVSVDPTRAPFANFVSGDNLDFISSATATDAAPGCFRNIGLAVLNPGNSCGMAVNFTTGDPRLPKDPDVDFGLWNLVTRVTLEEIGNPTNRVDLLPTVQVTVRDPVPEPSTSALLAIGILGLALYRWRVAGTKRERKEGETGSPS